MLFISLVLRKAGLITFRCSVTGVMVILVMLSSVSLANDKVAVLTLEEAVSKAVDDNPVLAQMQARAAAMAEIPSQIGALPDPRLMLNAMNVPLESLDTNASPMTQWQIGVSQQFPFPGKLALGQDAARHDAAAADANVQETRIQLIRDVRVVWWNLFYLDRALVVVAQNQELLRQFVAIARSKYEVGQGLQQDVLLAEVELSKLLDMVMQLENSRNVEQARLNALLDNPVNTDIVLPRDVVTELPEILPQENLRQLALENRPLLSALEKQVKAADKRLGLAHKDSYPDFNLAAVYGVREGLEDMGSIMFSMNLPLYSASRNGPKRAQRNLELQSRRYALEDSRASVMAEMAQFLSQYHRGREQARLFESAIIPQASQTVSAMRAGYQVNKVDFLNLVRAQITLYDYDTRYWKVFSEAQQALAQLVAAVGKENINDIFK